MLALSKVKMFATPTAASELSPIPATVSHFGTAGRLLSWFPTVNRNGCTVLSEDVDDAMVQTLVGSTIDLEHVKKSYGQHSMLVPRESNTTFGSILQAKRTAEGIDIATKLERAVAQGFGFTPEDFAPGTGILAQFSQEMDFAPKDGKYIVVDKDDPKKILRSLSYADGLTAGLPDVQGGVGPSKMVNGVWNYTFLDGNPVYFAVKPLSFCGAGHVAKPADPSAITYKLVANEAGEEKILGFYPGMDDGPAAPRDMIGLSDDMYNGNDLNVWGSDFLTHPDVLSASADKFDHDKEAADPKNKDEDFAVNYSKKDFSSVTNGMPNINRTRRFKIKNDKGDLDRPRLISAYRSLMGMRGDTHSNDMPRPVKAHALALVRQGLKTTQPKITKETSSHHMEQDLTIAQIDARIEDLKAKQKIYDAAAFDAERAKALAAEATVSTLTTSVSDKEAEIKTLTDKLVAAEAVIEEHKQTALANERLAKLEAIHPFTAEEKSEDFIKALASLSADGMEIAVLRRENAKLAADKAFPTRALASALDRPQLNPVPATGAGRPAGDMVSVGDLY